jgi:O-antigen/teichoic acid export membrane protein
MNLKRKVHSSLIWTFSDQIITQFVFVLFGIFLARILSPSAFGIVSMVVIFTNFAALFIDMGFGVALIQKKDADNEHYSSVFWLNLAIGIFLYLLFFIAAPFLSVFYHEPQITALVRVICLSFIINALSSIQSNLLIRDLKFKEKVIINWISMIVGYSVAFYLAYNNYGTWAIVWMTLATALVNTILYWLSSNWYPNFRFNILKIKELSSFGFNVLGDTTVNYWSRNFDNFLIARVLGSAELGLYTRAYSLMLLPLRNISSVITKVMFPAFSKKQDDIQSIKLYYLKIIKFISLLTFPAMIGLSLVSKEFVLLFFGASWSGMIGVLSILSLVGTFQSVFSLNGMIYNSLGKADIAFRVSIIVNTVLIIAFLIGINSGIIGMAWSYLIASLLLFYPIYNSVIKLLTIKWIEVFIATKGVIISTTIMALIILFLNYFLNMPLLFGFIIKIFVGIFGYAYSLLIFEKALINSFKQKIINLISKK